MSIIDRLLKRRGVKVEELDQEEKATLEGWQKILSKETIEVSDILEMCDMQIATIESQFQDMDRSDRKTDRLVIQHTIYKNLKNLIESPQAQRKSLIEYLTTLL